MRLFVAIEAKEVSDYLKSIQDKLRFKGVKQVEKFHLTLKFLGEVEENKVEQIKKALSKISFKPFELTLDTIGVFPNPSRINVIWVDVKEKQHITNLYNQIDACLKDYEDDRKFHPHITISRVKFLINKKEFKDKIDSITIQPEKIIVNEFKLIKSDLTPEGPIYTDLAIYKTQKHKK
ncbi:RNA 2',3'-cyclic phosphodiesterase [Candidatus Woesearchaeota archaeon]|nr:MAG: RNA 2',3'-cyclic phosphodiesterase [Candidatus Woesearchaeota archaeon]